jgi:hypothetical protein
MAHAPSRGSKRSFFVMPAEEAVALPCSRSGRLLTECIRGERTAIWQAGTQRAMLVNKCYARGVPAPVEYLRAQAQAEQSTTRERRARGTGKMLPPLRSMWSAIVPVKLSPFQTLQISTLREALIFLRKQWPPEKPRNSQSFERAMRMCTEAADGERSPAAARAAFIAAAREAGILGGQAR